MPRANTGPKLRLYGPDGKYGARKRRTFKDYVWYIVWSEGRDRKERSTGVRFSEGRDRAEQALRDFLGERAKSDPRPLGPVDPSGVWITEALTYYGREKAPHHANPNTYDAALKALVPFWSAYRISHITEVECRAYVEQRVKQGRKIGTARRELDDLNSAIQFYKNENKITYATHVWLPPKQPPRERWLTRDEVARLLRIAKRNRRARWHLPLFIMLAVRTGARTSAILQLQWQPNFDGGHVDLEKGYIDFKPLEKAATSKRRARIPIPRPLRIPLQLARRRTSQYVLEHQGKPIKQLRRSLPQAIKDAGLKEPGPNDTVAHTFRHTAITWAMQAGVNPYEVSGWFAVSLETLQRVYAHHSPDYMQEMLDHIERRPG